MNPSAGSTCKWKLTHLQEIITSQPEFIPFISITETALKPYILDAQVNIPDYNVFRADRRVRNQGGALLYIHQDLPATDTNTFDDTTCSSVICTVDSMSAIIVSAYRPPSAPFSSFRSLMSFIQSYIDSASSEKHSYDIIITGDFNFPNIDWGTITAHDVMCRDSNRSAQHLISFMNSNLMSQYVNVPTRLNNILDLVISNSDKVAHHVTSHPTLMSDHNLVKIMMPQSPRRIPTPPPPPPDPFSFRSCNLFKADYAAIKSQLDLNDWWSLRLLCNDLDEYAELVRLTTLQLCLIHSPAKDLSSQAKKSKPARHRATLRRRKRKLKARLRAIQASQPTSPIIRKLKDEISGLQLALRDSIIAQLDAKEKKAVSFIKENPRFFFSFAKQSAKMKSQIGPLYDNEGNLHQDRSVMANLLQDQYASVFSDPHCPDKQTHAPERAPHSTLSDLSFSVSDIEEAIDEIDQHAACGDYDIPAKLLKECKSSISFPIALIWKESLAESFIPTCFKFQLITPVHKKGSKAIPANYRPVSLTSPVIKIF